MNLTAWLVDTIYVSNRTGVTAGGDPQWSTPVAVKARVEANTRLIITDTGNEQQANHKIATITEIGQTDRVWLPGIDQTDSSESKRPILVNSATTKNGSFRYYEVFL